jgi:hypothetical protein
VPRALYTDWKNVYVRVPNAEERRCGESALTQFGRMCQKLGIRIIAASSPQAKGRIERAHGTHQDRLVKSCAWLGWRRIAKPIVIWGSSIWPNTIDVMLARQSPDSIITDDDRRRGN